MTKTNNGNNGNNSNNNITDKFYTIKYFEECLPILNKIIKAPDNKSCLISEEILKLYVKNKKQLKFAKQFDIDEVFDIIKWVNPKTTFIPVSIFTTNQQDNQQDNQQQQTTGRSSTDFTEIGAELLTNFFTNEIFPHIYPPRRNN